MKNNTSSDAPSSEIGFHKNGKIKSREFRLNGELHRDPADGPAEEGFDENGNVKSRIFRFNGKLLSEAEVDAILNPKPFMPCDSEIVIDGKRFLLVLQED